MCRIKYLCYAQGHQDSKALLSGSKLKGGNMMKSESGRGGKFLNCSVTHHCTMSITWRTASKESFQQGQPWRLWRHQTSVWMGPVETGRESLCELTIQYARGSYSNARNRVLLVLISRDVIQPLSWLTDMVVHRDIPLYLNILLLLRLQYPSGGGVEGDRRWYFDNRVFHGGVWYRCVHITTFL